MLAVSKRSAARSIDSRPLGFVSLANRRGSSVLSTSSLLAIIILLCGI